MNLAAIATHELDFVVVRNIAGVKVGGRIITRGVFAGTGRGAAGIGIGGIGVVIHWRKN